MRLILKMTCLVPSLQQAIIIRSSFAQPFIIDPPRSAVVHIAAECIPGLTAEAAIHQMAEIILRDVFEQEGIARFEERPKAGLRIGRILLLKLFKVLRLTEP